MSTRLKRINRNSPIRSGYNFEDLYVLKLCADWLRSPEIFKEIKIQYIPSEISVSGFAIDDIAVTLVDGSVCFYQLKHIQNPDVDFWDQEKLIQKGLHRWISSLEALDQSKILSRGYLITNGQSSTALAELITDGKFELARIQHSSDEFYRKLISNHSHEALEKFFLNFKFIFNTPDRKEFESEIREIFYYDLKVTESGVDRLLLYIIDQGNERYPEIFTLEKIRQFLSWDNPRPLNQNFEVPSDFEFFDKYQHNDLLSDLRKSTGGIKVITGKPGTGKSTYLSKLYSLLNQKFGVFTVRHHYHINPRDRTSRERLNSERVQEAFKFEFKKLRKTEIQELSYQNTQRTPLREFISRIAKFYTSQGKSFVLILDGLDHVIREGYEADELQDFLNEILYPQEGFWIVLGTQEMATPYFPNIIHRECPKEKWIEIKGLKSQAVLKLLKANKSKLSFSKDVLNVRELGNALFTKTQGNPLHIRYVLSQLKATDDYINENSFKSIPPYRNEIREYYEDLWRQIPSLSQTLAYAITSLDFKLQEEQVLELANYLTESPHLISGSYAQIKHLVRIDLNGLSVYHNSFLVFILSQPELAYQKKLLHRKIKEWLINSDNDELKWSELSKIEYYLGNDQPILSLNKDWVVQSVVDGRDEEQISNLLELTCEASFKKKDYKKLIETRVIQASFDNREYNLYEALDKIRTLSLLLKNKRSLRCPQLSKLNALQIKEILIELLNRNIIKQIPDEVPDRFNELLLDRNEYRNAAQCWIIMLANFDSEEFSRAYRFIKQFRSQDDSRSPTYFAQYLAELLRLGKENKIEKLIKCKLTKAEKQSVVEALAFHELSHNSSRWSKPLKDLIEDVSHTNYIRLYQVIRLKKIIDDVTLSPHYKFPTKVDYHSSKSDWLVDLYVDNFYNALFLSICNKKHLVQEWIRHPAVGWQIILMQKMFSVALTLAAAHRQKEKYEYSSFLSIINSIPKIDFYEDHDVYELRRAVIPVLVKAIVKIITIINSSITEPKLLNRKDTQSLIECHWIYRDDVVEILNGDYCDLSDDAYKYFCEYLTSNLQSDIIPFRDRANRYADLAFQAKKLGRVADSSNFLRMAAENTVAYGYHKDMLLYHVMRSIDYCGAAGSQKVKSYIRAIAPYLLNIRQLTDGDETSGFVDDLGEIMAKYDKNLLYNFYFHSLDSRDYYLSEKLLSQVISCLDFSSADAKALGATAIGRTPYLALEEAAETNHEAMAVLKEIHAILGETSFPDEYQRNDADSRSEPKRDDNQYDQILPDRLQDALESLTGKNHYARRYETSRYLLGWCKHWLDKNEIQKTSVIKAIKTIIEQKMHDTDYDLLNYIYEYVLIADRGFAFQCLVWSHANGNFWGDLWSRRIDESRTSWSRALKDFPERIDEFFELSIFNTGKYYGSKKGYFLPFPKATQFFIDFGKLSDAEKITEWYLNSLQLLFPDVNLSMPKFITEEKVVDEFEMLLRRLEWLSPLVRERSAWHLANLLEQDKSGSLHKRFLNWLYDVKLETFACYGLLIILKSLNNPQSFSYRHINVSKHEIVSANCMATELILQAICFKLSQTLFSSPRLGFSITYRKPDIEKDRFFRRIGPFLQFVYQDNIESLEEETGLEVWEIWYNFYKDRCNELEISDHREDKSYLRDRREYMTGCAPIQSEILKSTYLVTLDYLFFNKKINHGVLFHYIMTVFPIDISMWDLKITKTPDWWLKVKDAHDSDRKKLFVAEFEVSVEEMIFKNKSNNLLLYAQGASRTSINFYQSTAFGHIHLLPFAYRVIGGDLPSDEEIFRTLIQRSGRWLPGIRKFSRFGFFDNEPIFGNQSSTPKQYLKDLEIIPLVCEIRPTMALMWQYFRLFNPIKLLAPQVKGNLVLTTESNNIKYLQQQNVICYVKEFTMGIQDSSVYGVDVPCGNYMEINRAYMDNFLLEKKARLGYVYKSTFKTRDSFYSDEFQEVSFYKSINLSRIIV